MKKLWRIALILCLFLVTSSVCFSQVPAWDLLKQQEAYLSQLKKDNPKLYEFTKRLLEIQKEVQKIVGDYQKGKITEDVAKERLNPLLKEDIQIQNNPDYLVEMRLNMLLSGQLQQVPLR